MYFLDLSPSDLFSPPAPIGTFFHHYFGKIPGPIVHFLDVIPLTFRQGPSAHRRPQRPLLAAKERLPGVPALGNLGPVERPIRQRHTFICGGEPEGKAE